MSVNGSRALNHVSVTTANLDRALAFYSGVLGLTVIGRGETESRQLEAIIGLGPVRLRWAELDLGHGQFLELFEYVSPRGTPLRQRTADAGSVHFALTVDDVQALYDRLLATGTPMRSAPVTLQTGEWIGAKAVYAIDPDGVTVELVEFQRTGSEATLLG